jgi:hypothetical protein
MPPSPSNEKKEPTRPQILSYRPAQGERRRTSSGWQIAGGFGIYWTSIFLLTQSYPNYVPVWKSLTEWIVLTIILVVGAIGVGMQWNKWGYLKGIVATFLLTGAFCGLLFSICGNPFRPIF